MFRAYHPSFRVSSRIMIPPPLCLMFPAPVCYLRLFQLYLYAYLWHLRISAVIAASLSCLYIATQRTPSERTNAMTRQHPNIETFPLPSRAPPARRDCATPAPSRLLHCKFVRTRGARWPAICIYRSSVHACAHKREVGRAHVVDPRDADGCGSPAPPALIRKRSAGGKWSAVGGGYLMVISA